MISAMRLSSWVKNLAILPAWFYFEGNDLLSITLVFLAATFFSTGNYLFNEWSDRFQDAAHPTKKNRFFVLHPSRSPWYFLVFSWLVALVLAWGVEGRAIIVILALMLASLLYNSPTIRLKNRAHWDYLLEALNAPFRGLLGWIAAVPDDYAGLPAVLGAYYCLSLSVMLLKRRSEMLYFDKSSDLQLYRPSLVNYNPSLLNLLSVVCLICGIFLGAWAIYWIL